MNYKHIKMKNTIKIDSVVNTSKSFLDKNYIFEGESHDFWELQYMANGVLYVHSGNDFYKLRQGEVTFFRPNEFHVIYGDGQASAEMWVFSFQCSSPLLNKFSQMIFNVSEECKTLMQHILAESYAGFQVDPLSVDGRILRRKKGTPIGCEQLIQNRLECLLILMLRSVNSTTTMARNPSLIKYSLQDTLAESIHTYLSDHLYSSISLSMLAKTFDVSVSLAKKAYKKEYGCSIIMDLNRMKVSRAKELLHIKNLPIGEIGTALSFDNIYYFSSFFKHHTGMSPSAYRKLIETAQDEYDVE